MAHQRILQGEACAIMATLPSRSVDMIYTDPPFGTGMLWSGPSGSFLDKFKLDGAKLADFAGRCPIAGEFIRVAPIKNDHKAYLVMMGDLLLGCRRVLHLAGTLWLHCDDTMSHYLKIIGDLTFGLRAFLGQITWRRTAAHSDASKSFGRVHDTILVFARSRASLWRLTRLKCEFFHGDPFEQVFIDGYAGESLNRSSKERVGYPTQKPVALLERLIRSGCISGGMVLDPTCGSGNAVVASRNLGMSAIGIDNSADAVTTAIKRLGQRTEGQLSLFGFP